MGPVPRAWRPVGQRCDAGGGPDQPGQGSAPGCCGAKCTGAGLCTGGQRVGTQVPPCHFNLAQAVLLLGYEWLQLAPGASLGAAG